MASKMVRDRERSAEQVVSSVKTHGEQAGKALEEWLMPHVREGEQVPSVAFLLELMGRALELSAEQMKAANAAHDLELGDDASVRKTRDDAVAALYKRTTRLREIIQGLYGGEALGLLGVRGGTPTEDLALENFARDFAQKLRKETLPSPDVEDAKFDAVAEAQRLELLCDAVKQGRAAVEDEAAQAAQTFVAKHRALDAHDQTFSRVTRAMESLYILASQPELASHVRPSLTQPGRTEADVESNPGSPE